MASEVTMPTADVRLSELKGKAARMLAKMRASEPEIGLTQGGSVGQDFDAHQGQRRALFMLTLTMQAEADIQAGRTIPQGRVFAELADRPAPPEDG